MRYRPVTVCLTRAYCPAAAAAAVAHANCASLATSSAADASCMADSMADGAGAFVVALRIALAGRLRGAEQHQTASDSAGSIRL